MSSGLLTTTDVGEIFGVDAKTVVRWTNDGDLEAEVITAGGHRRYDPSEVDRLYKATSRGTAPTAAARALRRIGIFLNRMLPGRPEIVAALTVLEKAINE